MTQRRRMLGTPRDLMPTFPRGPVPDDGPIALLYAVQIARRLHDAIGGQPVSQVAASADLARSTLHDVLTGRSWPDVVTLAKLESVLETRLWPDNRLRRTD